MTNMIIEIIKGVIYNHIGYGLFSIAQCLVDYLQSGRVSQDHYQQLMKALSVIACFMIYTFAALGSICIYLELHLNQSGFILIGCLLILNAFILQKGANALQ